MRENWQYKPLGEICDFISGFTPSKQELNEKAGIPYFKVSDMNRDTNSVYMIETELFVVHPRKTIPANSIIFPKNGGAIFTGKKRILKYDSIIDLNTEALNIKDNNVNLQFLYTFLLGVDFGQFDNGGGLPSINIKKMKDFIVPVPPLPEQERIVSYLDAEFAKIDALKANIEQQLQASKDLFQSALKQLLTPKEGWEEKHLGEVCDFSSGFAFKSNLFTSVGEPIIRISDIQEGRVIEDSVAKFNIKSYDIDLSKYIVYPGDILIAMSGGTTGKVGINYTDKCFYLNQRVGVFREKKNKLNHKYLYFYLQTKSDESLKIAAGAAQPNLSTAQIKDFVIPLPSLPEQERIAARLDSLSAKVKALQENYNKALVLCNDLKQSLLKSIFE